MDCMDKERTIDEGMPDIGLLERVSSDDIDGPGDDSRRVYPDEDNHEVCGSLARKEKE